MNLKVETPLGEGVLQIARYQGRGDIFHYLVRLPVTDEVRLHLTDANCLTKKAIRTALFSFTAVELGLEELK